MTQQKGRLSVVIPTLGGDALQGTLDHLNAGSVVPDEILVCIPAYEAQRVAGLRAPNARVVATACRGQVPQRAVGFAQASYELVLQLDDDVMVEENCIERLISELHAKPMRVAVAPALQWTESRTSVYPDAPRRPLTAFFYWCVNGAAGYRAGTVTKAGTEIGVHCSGPVAAPFEAEWLPGGCVLHRKQDLVLENYFPLSGKAFCEDLIHSHLLRMRAVRLFVSTAAVAYIDRTPRATGPLSLQLRELATEMRARRYFVRLSQRSMTRMYLYFLAKLFGRMARYRL